MTRIGVIGLGKMGLSHLAVLGAHPDVTIAGICDSSSYVLSVLGKYSGFPTYSSLDDMLAQARLDGLLVATPTQSHAPIVRQAIAAGVDVFCEKPFCLDAEEATELAGLALAKGIVGQVGYHNRFVAAFQEVKRLVEGGSLGRITHVLAEAYGPVVLKPQGSTWRSQKAQGGGALYDYAAHPLNLATWYFGDVVDVRGAVLESVFSRETDDEVYAGLTFAGGATGQLSVNWSDESQRKMTTKITIWGTSGRVYADRQECQVFLRKDAKLLEGYHEGWNVRYTTDLTAPVGFYLRGEEYSAQLHAWVSRIQSGAVEGANDLTSAAATDRAIAMLVADARGERTTTMRRSADPSARPRWRRLAERRARRSGGVA
jgi:predicted dehydrogenase